MAREFAPKSDRWYIPDITTVKLTRLVSVGPRVGRY
jgi:hypothetical protein